MNRLWVRILLLAVVGGGVGLGLLFARPNLRVVWARISDLTLGEEGKEVAAPPDLVEAKKGSVEADCLSEPAISALAEVASIGAVDATHLSLPDVLLTSPSVAERIGLKVEPAVSRLYAPSITGNAEITYNANLYGEVRARVRGLVHEVLADEGSHYHKGDPMAVLDSAIVGTTKSDYLAALPVEKLARQTLEMTLALRKDNAAPLKDELIARKDMNTATAAVENARQRLRNLGLGKEDLERIEAEGDTSTLLKIGAPIEGTVVDRHCVAGEAVEQIDRLFVVADVSSMWAWVDVYESDIEAVKVGQPVFLTIAGTESPVFHGHVDWIDTALNPTTRTIRVRAEVENPTGRLRANEFGRARIQVGDERQAIFVPKDSVQALGKTHVVFRRISADRYAPVRVTTAESDNPNERRILSGLRAGQSVVSTGAFLLKSELKKDEIAGEE